MKNLYDHHIHLGYGDCKRRVKDGKYDGQPIEVAYNNLLQYKDSDITTLRDGGDKAMFAYQLKKEAAALGITLKTAGRAVVKKGCYGIHLGEPVATMDELKRELDFLIEKKVDCIKITQSGLVDMTGAPQIETANFSEAELACIRRMSAEAGLPVMVHVNFPVPIRSAVEAGVDTIEHGYFITEEILKLMAANHVAWTPTLAPFANVLTYGKAIKGWDINVVKAIVAQQKRMIRRGVELGVTILMGSDSGSSIVPHCRGTHDEYQLLHAILGDNFQAEDKREQR